MLIQDRNDLPIEALTSEDLLGVNAYDVFYSLNKKGMWRMEDSFLEEIQKLQVTSPRK